MIRVDRYRLSSERLVLTRTARGVEVEGEGRVAFCPCARAPISFGFKRAIVAPPTDLFVQGATFRIGDVPVLYSPVLWLRSPDRLGLTAPRIAWRAEDGLFAGSGVHVPLGGRRGPTLSSVDLFLGGYLQGGGAVETRLVTPASTTFVRFDHLRDSALDVDSHGSSTNRLGVSGAFRVDAVRGARGRRASIELEPAARRFDSARASVSAASEAGVVGAFGAEATLDRGTDLARWGALGPVLELGYGTALGHGASVDAAVGAATLRREGEGLSSRVVEHARLKSAHALGPVALDFTTEEAAELDSRSRGSAGELAGAGRLGIGLPLERRFGAGPDPWLHRLEPRVVAGARLARLRSENELEPRDLDELTRERALLGYASLRSELGRYGAREAFELDLRAGGLTPEPDTRATLALGALGAADSEWLGLGADGAIDPEGPESATAAARLRVGRADQLHAGLRAEGRAESEPLAPRVWSAPLWSRPARSVLDRPGWSLGASLGVPWFRELASEVGAEYDVNRERLLAWRTALGYRHPCGCIAALGRVGQRLGRDGVDAEVTLDLMP